MPTREEIIDASIKKHKINRHHNLFADVARTAMSEYAKQRAELWEKWKMDNKWNNYRRRDGTFYFMRRINGKLETKDSFPELYDLFTKENPE